MAGCGKPCGASSQCDVDCPICVPLANMTGDAIGVCRKQGGVPPTTTCPNCTNSNQCPGGGCSRCNAAGQCVIGFGCGATCTNNLECDQTSLCNECCGGKCGAGCGKRCTLDAQCIFGSCTACYHDKCGEWSCGKTCTANGDCHGNCNLRG